MSVSNHVDSTRLNLLYLVHRIPYPPNRGDRIRSYHLLRFLAARYNVHLACLADEPVSATDHETLKSLCTNLAVIPLESRCRWLRAVASMARGRSASEGLFESPVLRSILNDWAAKTKYDAAVAFCSTMTPYLHLPALVDIPAIIDLVDADSQKWFDYAETASGLKRRLFSLEGRRVRRLEHDAARRARALTVVSEAEAEICREHCSPTPVYGIGNGVDLDYFGDVPALDAAAGVASQCVFIGALDYRANVDGIAWFCREVWSEVRKRRPQAMFTVVGRNPTAAVRKLAELPGVKVIADVPDVRPYLSRAAVVVAPLRVARGIQNKVLEALAATRAVVGTSEALEGIDLKAGQHALRADTPEDWIAALCKLFDDSAARSQLGAAGRAFVEKHHGWAPRLGPFEDLLSAFLSSRRELAATSCE